MVIVALALVASLRATPSIFFEIDTSSRKPISPYIYGANFPDWKTMQGVTLARQGGNRMTAYNWENNASNAGNDYHYQNDGYLGITNEPGWTAGSFMSEQQAHGAAVLLTVPTAGYVSADKKGDGNVMDTPDWIHARFIKSYAHKPGGHFTYPPDTGDRAVYQDEFVSWIEKTKKRTSPVWFSLDNEPDLWASTHKEIVPKPLGYADIIANNAEFGSAIKAVAPDALVFGPANYGWQGFRTFQNASDAGGRDFLDVYLDGMRQVEHTKSKRILDVLDIHWYPEARGGGVRIASEDDKAGTPEARIQAPRSLWDPSYVEDSWIADSLGKKPIVLLPKIQGQIEAHYPGTKFAITEYNYGGGKVISGAIAQADVLGIFGRCGLFAATNFGISSKDTAMIAGIKAFVNYDGAGGKFGDIGLTVNGGSPEMNSVYASLSSRDPKRLTLVAINKTSSLMPMTFNLRSFVGSKVRVFEVTADHASSLEPDSAILDRSTVKFQSPPLSVSVIEVDR